MKKHMVNIKDKSRCCGCKACYNICPKQAISMIEDEKGFQYPKVNKEKCINCGLCEKACPFLNKKKTDKELKAYAVKNKNIEIRMNSSSGGVFSIIAKYILENKGVVFGASFDNDLNVKHIMIKDEKDLYKLRTSKYVQSDINDTYRETKMELEKGKMVLFTGVPCQIYGLVNYLGKNYDNLYTQDVICHGVPSPKVWRKYLEYIKNKNNNEEIASANFRFQNPSWKDFEMKFSFHNPKIKDYHKRHDKDLYMNLFLQDTILRDSCYKCYFRDYKKISDVTLGDFWGIQNVDKNIDDDRGTSVVIVNTEKGKKLFEEIKKKSEFKEVKYENVLKYNPALTESPKVNKNREQYFKSFDNVSFEKNAKKYIIKDSFIKRGLRKIKRIGKKLLENTNKKD